MTTAWPGAIDSWSTKVDSVDDVLAAHINNPQDAIIALETAGGLRGPAGLCEGRLTLQSGVAISTADQAAKTTVYFTPLNGGRVSMFNNTGWITRAFNELSIAVPGVASTPFDVFVYDNAGAATLETVNWTNDTTRATALTTYDAVPCKNGDLTRRYLGTCRATSVSGQCEDSAAARFVWNYYNRVPRPLRVLYTGGSHTYNTATWRYFNGTLASGVQFVLGRVLDPILAILKMNVTRVAGDSFAYVGIGVNSATPTTGYSQVVTLLGTTLPIYMADNKFGIEGQNTVAAAEFSGATGTAPTFADVTLWVTIQG